MAVALFGLGQVLRLLHLESKDIEMTVFLRTFVLALLFAWGSQSATAQPHDWRSGLTQTPPITVPFEMDYQLRNERLLPIHFSIQVPFGNGPVQTQTRGMPDGNIYEVRFLTPDGALLEYLTLSSGTIDAATPDEVHRAVFNVIEQFVYPSIGFPADAEVLGGRIADFDGHQAVEFMAISSEPDQRVIVARIVGVVSPNGRDVLFFVQQTLRDRMGIAGPDEMAMTYAGVVAQSVAFIAFRDADGVTMVPF